MGFFFLFCIQDTRAAVTYKVGNVSGISVVDTADDGIDDRQNLLPGRTTFPPADAEETIKHSY